MEELLVQAEVFGNQADLTGGVAVTVAVPARLLEGCYQFRTAVDVVA